MEIVDIEDIFTDRRGSIVQVASGDWRQLNVVNSKKGVVRGGHYHEKARELFYVLEGEVEVRCINVDNGTGESHTFGKHECFIVHPREQHYMKYYKDTMLLVLYSAVFDKARPDLHVSDKYPSPEEAFCLSAGRV